MCLKTTRPMLCILFSCVLTLSQRFPTKLREICTFIQANDVFHYSTVNAIMSPLLHLVAVTCNRLTMKATTPVIPCYFTISSNSICCYCLIKRPTAAETNCISTCRRRPVRPFRDAAATRATTTTKVK